MNGRRLWESTRAYGLIALIVLSATSCTSAPPPPSGLSWRTAHSLASSLLHRICNHRLAKGDTEGAERIKHMLSSFDSGLFFWTNMGSIAWDYAVHYSWRSLNPSQIFDVLRLIGDIQSALTEFAQLRTDMDRLRWISINYSRILQLAKASLQKLLKLFDHPGALRNLVLSLQTEVLTGDILRDAMQLGADDLRSLVQVVKEMVLRYYGQTSTQSSSEL
ncbi:hypothetical protein GOP47_0025713 [Adiantum capillus-veneris]|uniref:Uncharacterized protein n=1 Tax=Adiantum capillus-veneris TaxID=13818 RepID=A0A9D4Z371_ADICA|nr:hypothetical protein GOP47_0025713 [Adiantum capillus-veneris]